VHGAIATHTATSGDTEVETLQNFSMFEQTIQFGIARSRVAFGSFRQHGRLALESCRQLTGEAGVRGEPNFLRPDARDRG
jgi:hypothetical protein